MACFVETSMRRHLSNSCKLSDLSREIELEFCGFGTFIQRIRFALCLWWAQYLRNVPAISTKISNPVDSLHHAQRMHGLTKLWEFEPVLFCRSIRAWLFWFLCAEGFKKGKNSSKTAIVQLTPICLQLLSIVVKGKQLVEEQVCGGENNGPPPSQMAMS